MKRFLIFVCLGPLVGLLPVMLMVGVPELKVLAVMVMVAYMVGLLPALAAWGVDRFLFSKMSTGTRVYFTAFAGLAVVLALALLFSNSEPLEVAMFGAAGAFAAVVCSWMSSEKQKEPA
jgi:hypothetical protein